LRNSGAETSGPLNRIVERVWLFFASVKLTVVLLVLLALAMAYGTYVETNLTNGAARILVYRTWWFDSLLGVLALNFIGCTLRRAPYKPHQYPWIATHIALLILMIGAVVTHRLGVQGQMTIAEGDADSTYYVEQLDRAKMDMVAGEPRSLPFRIRCVKFDQLFYPGTGTARLFRSQVEVLNAAQQVTLQHDVVLNHPLVYKSYKISQASFMELPDGRHLTVLGVSYDPGISFMYVGGALLVISMAGIFFLKPYLKRKFPPPPKRPRDNQPQPTAKAPV
jgi:cytochrome c biogenesis protein ResB